MAEITWRIRKFVSLFAHQWVLQRGKAHGAGKAPITQAFLFSWMGAWIASRGLGPNPWRVLWWITGARTHG